MSSTEVIVEGGIFQPVSAVIAVTIRGKWAFNNRGLYGQGLLFLARFYLLLFPLPSVQRNMLRRSKKGIQASQLRISEDTVPDHSSWSMEAVKRIIRSFGLSEEPFQEPADEPLVIVPQKEPVLRAKRPAFPARCIVFSDTDNDVTSVRNTLRFAGILNENGELTGNLEEITILHTGDLIDKKNPDPSVVEYWQLLRQDALAKGWHVKLIVGNHEQEIWQKIKAGEKCGMKAKQARCVNDFIEGLDLFYVAGPVLFIHGYPTLEFLQTLLHFEEVTGKDLNCFNIDHYKKAVSSVNGIRQYAYVRENRRANYLLYDVANASRYYKKQGRAVSAVLAQLKIDIVVHGHRPQRSGVQVDYEFSKWIPNIRMIGNDTMVRHKGIGATVIKTASSGALDVIFVNAKTESNKLRRKLRQALSEPRASSCGSRLTGLEIADIKSAAQG